MRTGEGVEKLVLESIDEVSKYIFGEIDAALGRAIKRTSRLKEPNHSEYQKIASAIKTYTKQKIIKEADDKFIYNEDPTWNGIPIDFRLYGFVEQGKDKGWLGWLLGISCSTPITELGEVSGVDGRTIFEFLSCATNGIESAFFHNEAWFYDVYGKKPVVRTQEGAESKKKRSKGTIVMMATMEKYKTVGGYSIGFQELWALGEDARGYIDDQRATARKAFDRIYEPYNRTQ